METEDKTDLETLMLSPYEYFSGPREVARSDRLTKAEKLCVLKSMEADARELEIADEENMGGGEQHTLSLSAVRKAMQELDPEAAARSEAARTSKAL